MAFKGKNGNNNNDIKEAESEKFMTLSIMARVALEKGHANMGAQ